MVQAVSLASSSLIDLVSIVIHTQLAVGAQHTGQDWMPLLATSDTDPMRGRPLTVTSTDSESFLYVIMI
jgi:hypothetical protein